MRRAKVTAQKIRVLIAKRRERDKKNDDIKRHIALKIKEKFTNKTI